MAQHTPMFCFLSPSAWSLAPQRTDVRWASSRGRQRRSECWPDTLASTWSKCWTGRLQRRATRLWHLRTQCRHFNSGLWKMTETVVELKMPLDVSYHAIIKYWRDHWKVNLFCSIKTCSVLFGGVLPWNGRTTCHHVFWNPFLHVKIRSNKLEKLWATIKQTKKKQEQTWTQLTDVALLKKNPVSLSSCHLCLFGSILG